MLVGFVGSSGMLHYSLWLNGLGYQTGFTPWWNWVRGQRRGPGPSGARRLPLVARSTYLSFMGTVWFTPTVTLDRAILIAIWTSYIFIGSWLKDRRLEFYLGEYYREYEARVPGYPGMIFGPLGPNPLAAAVSAGPSDGHGRRSRVPLPAWRRVPLLAWQAGATAGLSSGERGLHPARPRPAIMDPDLQLSSR